MGLIDHSACREANWKDSISADPGHHESYYTSSAVSSITVSSARASEGIAMRLSNFMGTDYKELSAKAKKAISKAYHVAKKRAKRDAVYTERKPM
mgnify:CR=1 FL=1